MPTLPINVHGPVRPAGGRRACLFAGVLLLCLASPGAAQLAIGGLAGASLGASNTGAMGSGSFPGPALNVGGANFNNPDNTNAGFSYGAEVGYRWRGLMLGVLAHELKVPLTSDTGDIGQFRARATLFTLGYQSRPAKGKGMAWHTAFGAGFARTNFKQGTEMALLSQAYRSKIVVATKDPPAYMCSFGLDVFINSHASITLFDVRGFWTTASATWTAVDRHPNVTFIDVSPFRGSGLQMLGGVKFWIH